MVYRGLLIEGAHSRDVAVKTLAAGALPHELVAFQKELRTLTMVAQRCDGVCRLFGAVEDAGRLYLIMKLYDCSLDEHLRQTGPLAPAVVLDFAMQLAQTLFSLHKERVIVKDLKPANVLLENVGGGIIKVVISDFGISAIAEATVTSSRGVAGTPQFMAPEQFDDDTFGKVSVKADIWAFGCVLVSMLSGGPIWPDGVRDMQIMHAITVKRQGPKPPDGTPVAILELITKCLEVVQSKRPAAEALLPMLKRAQHNVEHGSDSTISCPVGRSGRHIFLSYRRIDRELATNIKLVLEKLGYIVFMDIGDCGLGGGDFQAQLEDVLKNTPVVVKFFLFEAWLVEDCLTSLSFPHVTFMASRHSHCLVTFIASRHFHGLASSRSASSRTR
eukprot:SAG11_NODE_4721_length_1793_cov_1.502952_2_plen_387_part_00